MADRSTTALAKLVDQKRRLLEQLLAVGRRQGELIGEGDIASLLKLLTAKQQLIAALRSVEQSLAPFHTEDPDTRQWPSPQHRTACAADSATCERLLAEVIALEKEQEGQMVRRRDGVAERLQKTQSAHAASAAYQPHKRPSSPTTPLPSPDSPGLSGSLDLSTTN